MAAGVALAAASLVPVSQLGATPAVAAQSPASCPAPVALSNGGFESPVITGNSTFGWAGYYLDSTPNIAWNTTAYDHKIEIWEQRHGGFSADSGTQFAELNATVASSLYQDVATTPGQQLGWSLAHRGRSGVDVMRVMIGDPNGALVQSGPDLSDGNTAWGTHTGVYTVPAGQTVTRFSFVAVSSTGGDQSYGNFLDSIVFSNGPCLVANKTVTDANGNPITGPMHIGERLRYTVEVANNGGSDAILAAVSDVLPSTVTYVPGSIAVIRGPSTGPRTDAAGDDSASFDPSTRTIAANLGAGATSARGGTIPAASVVAISYDVIINAAAAGGAVQNEATVIYSTPLSLSTPPSTTQLTSTQVALEPTAVPDTPSGAYNTPVTFAPLANDSVNASNAAFDPSSVRLLNGSTPVTSLTVPGEGTYTVNTTTGEVTFVPLPSFSGRATPVRYQASTTRGVVETSSITVTTGAPGAPAATDDWVSASAGHAAVFTPLSNDSSGPAGTSFTTSTLRLVDPNTNASVLTVTVPGQGTWSVDPSSGQVTFTPVAGFSGIATPIGYRAQTNAGTTVAGTMTATIAAPVVATTAAVVPAALTTTPLSSLLALTGLDAGLWVPLLALLMLLTGVAALTIRPRARRAAHRA